MSKQKLIEVKGKEIALLSQSGTEDYISLTDIMKSFNDEFAIYGWMRNRNTLEFLGEWEIINNPDGFKGNEFVRLRSEAGLNNFNLTPKKWIDNTDAIGIVVKAGRYASGTFAHRDIAINFCYWLSPTFQLYLIREFDRLKKIEAEQAKETLEWNFNRLFTKLNFHLHADAVRIHRVPEKLHNTKFEGLVQASEADLLNLAIFGVTAKQWRESNPRTKGNIRDEASAIHLLVLANLENLNAEFIKQGLSKDERLRRLNDIAIYQIQFLLDLGASKRLIDAGK